MKLAKLALLALILLCLACNGGGVSVDADEVFPDAITDASADADKDTSADDGALEAESEDVATELDLETSSDAEVLPSEQLLVTALEPARGGTAGGESVLVHGQGFLTGSQVMFGEQRAEPVFVVNDRLMTVTTPPSPPGLVALRVTRPDGEEFTLPSAFLYLDPLRVDAILPSDGSLEGGEPFTVRGRGFLPGSRVYIGERAAPGVEILADDTLIALTPPGVSGSAAVYVANESGSASLAPGFIYREAPQVDAVVPARGVVEGGSPLRVIGRGFVEGSVVQVGGEQAPVLDWRGDGDVLVLLPPGTPGPADLRVVSPWGETVAAGAFEYFEALGDPAFLRLDAVTPSAGSVHGGELVRLALSGFSPGELPRVHFGGSEAEVLEADAGWGLVTVLSPPGEAGAPVALRVDVAEDSLILDEAWTWLPGPRIDSVDPASGPVEGGTLVTLRGEDLAEVFAVRVGPFVATEVELLDAQTLRFRAPAAAPGPSDLTVVSPEGSAALAAGFEYLAPFRVDVITPDAGAQAGGTWVRLLGSGFAEGAELRLGGSLCTHLVVEHGALISGRTAPHPLGVVDVLVTAGAGPAALSGGMEQGFTYFDPISYYGGTWGGQASGEVNVTVLDAAGGAPLPSAYVILGTDPDTAHQGYTNAAGQVTFSGPDVDGAQMVSASKDCFSSSSIVDYEASNATLFLSPVCGNGGGMPPGVSPGIISGHVHGVDKMIVVPPGRCGTKDPAALPNGACLPCVDTGDCFPGGVCHALEGDNGATYCLPACLAPSDCPPTFACASLPGGDLHCLPKKGRREVRCETTAPAIANWIGSQLVDPGSEALVDEDGFYRIVTRLGQLSVLCVGGVEDYDNGQFEPLVMGVRRHIDPLPGVEIEDMDVELSVRLEGSLTFQLDDPPLDENWSGPGPHFAVVILFLDLGSDGFWAKYNWDLGEVDAAFSFGDESIEATGIPREFTGDLYDASFAIWAAAISDSPTGTPQSLAMMRGIRGVEDDQVLLLDAGAPIDPATGDQQGLVQVAATGIQKNIYELFGFAQDAIYAVGADGLIAHWNGYNWGPQYSGQAEDLRDIHGPAPDDLYAVGDGGSLVHFDGTSWTTEEVPTSNPLGTVWGFEGGEAWAAGNYVVLRRGEAGWSKEGSQIFGSWNDAWGTREGVDSASTQLVLVGDWGGIARLEGDLWVQQSASIWVSLNGVWGLAGDDIWAVGEEGTILHWDGASWTPEVSGTTETLHAVWGPGGGSDEVWAAGDRGTILRRSGGVWQPVGLAENAQNLRGLVMFEDGLGMTTGMHELLVTPFLSVPEMVYPADGGVMEDLRIEWTADPGVSPHLTMVVVSIPGLFGPTPVWDMVVGGEVTEITLPDFANIEGTPGVGPGFFDVQVVRIYREGLNINDYDVFDLDPSRWRAWSLIKSSFSR